MFKDILRGIVDLLDGSLGRFDDAAVHGRELELRHAELLAEEAQIIEGLARVHLPELTSEVIAGSLRSMQGKLEVALRRQEERKIELREALRTRESRAAEAVDRVDRMGAIEQAVAEQVREAQGRVRSRLEGDEEFLRLSAEHTTQMGRRDELKTRRARLLAVASAERPAYESDPLFVYLKEKGFDDPTVERGLFARWLDGWLAKRIDFERLARNHRILKVGPHQIQAEVARLSRAAADLEGPLDQIESKAAGVDGLTSALEEHAKAQTRLVEAREAAAEADADLERIGKELRDTELSRGRVHSGAIEEHAAFLKEKGVAELGDIARATADPRDDALVEELKQVRGWIENVQGELGASTGTMRHETRSVDQLGELGRALRSRFSSRRSVFPEGFSIQPKLDALLGGKTTLSEILDDFKVAHVREPIVLGADDPELDDWFGSLAEAFEVELEGFRDDPGETTVIVRDAQGRAVRKRITRRGPLVHEIITTVDLD